MEIRYFDHAATTGVREEVLKEMLPYFEREYGNASSLYTLGRRARKAIETARQRVAKTIGAKQHEIYFTSCGSESDNLAIKGIAYANKEKGNHIITSKIEHPAVLHTCQNLERQGFKVTYLNVDTNGFVSLKELENAITEQTILISIMYANNEIGTIQPIPEIGAIAKKHGIIFHTDAVQGIGNVKIEVKKENIDVLSLSAHKFYGPKGVGALYVKAGIPFEKIQDGGHQEKDKRAGTENVAGIVGLGKAIELAYQDMEANYKKTMDLREYYLNQIQERIPNIKINGDRQKRLPGNVNISFLGVDGQEMLLAFDRMGICASAGSACSSGSVSPSHVLLAIGLNSEQAQGTVRITMGMENTKEEVEKLVEDTVDVVETLRKMTS